MAAMLGKGIVARAHELVGDALVVGGHADLHHRVLSKVGAEGRAVHEAAEGLVVGAASEVHLDQHHRAILIDGPGAHHAIEAIDR